MPRKLTSLEKKVSSLFRLAGFKVYTSLKIGEFILPVLAAVGEENKIIFDFRHENSELVLRELIETWVQRKKEMDACRIVLVISGIEVLGEDKQIAREQDILVWEESNLDAAISEIKENPEEGKKKLLDELGIRAHMDENVSSFVPTQDFG